MKKLILLFGICLVFSCGPEESVDPFDTSNNIYLDANGVTIKCPDASIGEKGTLNGKEYTVVDNTILREMIADDEDITCVCTSKVSEMKGRVLPDFNNCLVNDDIKCPTNKTYVSFFWNLKNAREVYYDTEIKKDFFTQFNQDISSWDTSGVIDMSGMFAGCMTFNYDIKYWDTSNVTDMSNMFTDHQPPGGENFPNPSINYFLDIGSWDTSSVTDMSHMFAYNLRYFKSDISNWDISNVTNMSGMFSSSVDVASLDISNWDVSNVTDMSGMFFSNNIFNSDISNWDVSSVTNMNHMFGQARKFNQDIGDWDVSSVTDMYGMFGLATMFNQDIGNWNTSNVTDMGAMFEGLSSNHSQSKFNRNIGDWDVSNVTNMYCMFKKNYFFNQDISDWDVSNVTNMYSMFNQAIRFNQDISGWCVSKIASEPHHFTDCLEESSNNIMSCDYSQPIKSSLIESYRPIWGTCPQ
jgi:surface protein